MTWIGRTQLEALAPDERSAALAAFRAAIDARLARFPDWDPFWREARVIIDELKTAGHDIWMWDYDGDRRQLWGWDYMRPETAGSLQVQFTHAGPCQTFWRDEEWRLGTDSGER